jgi:hypothetical protein
MRALRDTRLKVADFDSDNTWLTSVNHNPAAEESRPPPPAAVPVDHGITMLLRRRAATYRRLLEDTADLLALLRYARTEDETAAIAQMAAIRELLME